MSLNNLKKCLIMQVNENFTPWTKYFDEKNRIALEAACMTFVSFLFFFPISRINLHHHWALSAPQPMPHAAAVTGVTYKVMDTQSSQRCPCVVKRPDIKSSEHQTYVSYSAANISVMATNAAGSSPPAIIQVPAQPAADLKSMWECVCVFVCVSISCVLILK